MKKMKLQMLGLSVNDLLSREQMKKVMGGSGGGSGTGTYTCNATAKKGYHVESPGSCTGTLSGCNTTCANWCATATGCASCTCS